MNGRLRRAQKDELLLHRMMIRMRGEEHHHQEEEKGEIIKSSLSPSGAGGQ